MSLCPSFDRLTSHICPVLSAAGKCATEWDQSRRGVIAAAPSGADNNCDWSVKADCHCPIAPTSLHTHIVVSAFDKLQRSRG